VLAEQGAAAALQAELVVPVEAQVLVETAVPVAAAVARGELEAQRAAAELRAGPQEQVRVWIRGAQVRVSAELSVSVQDELAEPAAGQLVAELADVPREPDE
jgi:hypothetical protein